MISKDNKELARIKQIEVHWVLHNIIDKLPEGDSDGKENS